MSTPDTRMFLGISAFALAFAVGFGCVASCRPQPTCSEADLKCPVGANLNQSSRYEGGRDIGAGFRVAYLNPKDQLAGTITYKDFKKGECAFQCTYIVCPNETTPRISSDAFECAPIAASAEPKPETEE